MVVVVTDLGSVVVVVVELELLLLPVPVLPAAVVVGVDEELDEP
jgi:hypothetical protein